MVPLFHLDIQQKRKNTGKRREGGKKRKTICTRCTTTALGVKRGTVKAKPTSVKKKIFNFIV